MSDNFLQAELDSIYRTHPHVIRHILHLKEENKRLEREVERMKCNTPKMLYLDEIC